ncbi:kinase-like domain-containing protein [Cytidiella melzeri]|nr:kinase-like domain-containing protein [Cytidiella melzeri]
MSRSIPTSRLLGTTIESGRLHLSKLIGRGASGVVFCAVDTATQVQYAVKCVPKANPRTRHEMFQERELRFHQTVSNHPNIVTLHRIFEEGLYIYLVMDLCEGGDMFKYLTEKRTFRQRDTELVKRVFIQLIDAVEVCHRHGIYHRDVKPENIMCNEDATQVRLADFGLATDAEWSWNFGAGTSMCMSPECIGWLRGARGYSPAGQDVWSLGVLLTSMISGHNPWVKAVMDDDCFRTYVGNPRFFREMLPISAEADAILRRIFTKENNRISLSSLRCMIVDVNTFYLTDDEIANASRYVQMAAAAFLHRDDESGPSREGTETSIAIEEVDRTGEESKLDDIVLSPRRSHSQDTTTSGPHCDDDLTLVNSRVSDLAILGARTQKRSIPPPQPMPSYDYFMGLMEEELQATRAESFTKAKSTREPHSPMRSLRRWMERIFV